MYLIHLSLTAPNFTNVMGTNLLICKRLDQGVAGDLFGKDVMFLGLHLLQHPSFAKYKNTYTSLLVYLILQQQMLFYILLNWAVARDFFKTE